MVLHKHSFKAKINWKVGNFSRIETGKDLEIYVYIIFVLTPLTNVNICFRGVNELRNLHYLPRASEPRETLVEDRTRAHADHIGAGFDRHTTAAVGILKAIHCGQP